MTIERITTFVEMETDGATAAQIAGRLGVSMRQVRRLRRKIADHGIESIVSEHDANAEEEIRDQQERTHWCDEAFQTAMRAAIAAGLEQLPATETEER